MSTFRNLNMRLMDDSCWWCPKPLVEVSAVRDEEGLGRWLCWSCDKPAYKKLK